VVRPGDVIREARALAKWKAVAGHDFEEALAVLAPHLEGYAELVVAEHGLEVITGGIGSALATELARLAAGRGAPRAATDAFVSCAHAFPERMLGLKLCFGPPHASPTLYVRTLAPRAGVIDFVRGLPGIAPAAAALDRALADNTTVYGLGFSAQQGELVLKTYTIADVSALGSEERPGFVSYRVAAGELRRETKRYLPDLPWNELPPWYRDVRQHVPSERVGHLGVVEVEGSPPDVKLYLERIGAITSDFSAR
jgi:hypothetical protein